MSGVAPAWALVDKKLGTIRMGSSYGCLAIFDSRAGARAIQRVNPGTVVRKVYFSSRPSSSDTSK